jgi:hypothetical protein
LPAVCTIRSALRHWQAAGGYIAECVSKGRLALFSDNKTKVRPAPPVGSLARTTLARLAAGRQPAGALCCPLPTGSAAAAAVRLV